MAFVNSDGASPVINLGGGSGGSFDLSGLPTGGGGMATNYGNQAMATDARAQAQGPPMFVGWTKASKVPAQQAVRGGYRDDFADVQHGVRSPVMMTPFELLQAFDQFDRNEYLKFKNKLVGAGFVSASAGPADVRAAYASVLQDVYDMQTAGASISPMEYVNTLLRKNGIDPSKVPSKDGWDPAAKKKGDGFKPSTTTATSVYDLDPAQAETMLTQMLQQKLGRDPTKTEIQDFADAVKTRSLNDPATVTTSKMRGDQSALADGNTSVAVTQIGGHSYSQVKSIDPGFSAADAQLLAQKRAENAPDYKSYQAVSTYFPALVQALGATV